MPGEDVSIWVDFTLEYNKSIMAHINSLHLPLKGSPLQRLVPYFVQLARWTVNTSVAHCVLYSTMSIVVNVRCPYEVWSPFHCNSLYDAWWSSLRRASMWYLVSYLYSSLNDWWSTLNVNTANGAVFKFWSWFPFRHWRQIVTTQMTSAYIPIHGSMGCTLTLQLVSRRPLCSTFYAWRHVCTANLQTINGKRWTWPLNLSMRTRGHL